MFVAGGFVATLVVVVVFVVVVFVVRKNLVAQHPQYQQM